jgi:hypothetical protein
MGSKARVPQRAIQMGLEYLAHLVRKEDVRPDMLKGYTIAALLLAAKVIEREKRLVRWRSPTTFVAD